MAKYSRMERFGITVILILVVIIAVGIVLILINRSTEEDKIVRELKEVKQQIGESTQESSISENNEEKIEIPVEKKAEEIELKEYNKEIDKSKPELIF